MSAQHSETFETVTVKGREYVVYFHAGTDRVYEVTVWTKSTAGHTRRLRRVWSPVSSRGLTPAVNAIIQTAKGQRTGRGNV
jgi:hypothetical protein